MNVKFYLSTSGRSPVEEFLENCSSDLRHDFVDAVLKLTSGQNLSMPLSRNLANIHSGLHELRLKDRAGQVMRFTCFTLLERSAKTFPQRK